MPLDTPPNGRDLIGELVRAFSTNMRSLRDPPTLEAVVRRTRLTRGMFACAVQLVRIGFRPAHALHAADCWIDRLVYGLTKADTRTTERPTVKVR